MSRYPVICATASICALLATASGAQDVFTLSSPEIVDGGILPSALKCTRDGGDGVSPPLAWSKVPAGTESLAVIMHHYPRGAVAGRDAPSQYWLLWNIPPNTSELDRANPASIGDEGADKDERQTGYTPPCSPPGSAHEYTITVYALDAPLTSLPENDDIFVDWEMLTVAMAGKVITSSQISLKIKYSLRGVFAKISTKLSFAATWKNSNLSSNRTCGSAAHENRRFATVKVRNADEV